MNHEKNIIELKDITVRFDGETVLDDLNLSIRDGEFVTLLGSSGRGRGVFRLEEHEWCSRAQT